MFNKNNKNLDEHIFGIYKSLKSISPFLNLISFTGTIYLVSNDYHSIVRNSPRKSEESYLETQIPLFENKLNLEKFIKSKMDQYSCKGFVALDLESSNYFQEFFTKNKVIVGVPLIRTTEGNISYWLYLKNKLL